MNIVVHILFLIWCFWWDFFTDIYIAQSGPSRSYSSSNFSILRNHHTFFHSGCTNLHPHRTVLEGSLFSASLPTFVLCALFDDSHSDRCDVVFLFTFPWWFNDAEYLFMSLLATCISSLEKCLFSSSAQFLIKLFMSWYCIGRAVYICWTIIPYLSNHLQIFSPIQYAVFLFCWWFPLLCKNF